LATCIFFILYGQPDLPGGELIETPCSGGHLFIIMPCCRAISDARYNIPGLLKFLPASIYYKHRDGKFHFADGKQVRLPFDSYCQADSPGLKTTKTGTRPDEWAMMEEEQEKPGKPDGDTKGSQSGKTQNGWATMKGGMWILFFTALGGVLLQHIAFLLLPPVAWHVKPCAAGAGLAAFLAVALLGLKREPRRFLGSVRFAVPVLCFVTLMSILGTLIVQGAGREIFTNLYGPYLSWLFEMMHMQDLFHSFGFSAVLGAGAGGVLLALFPLTPMTLSRFARLLAHGSILVILAGAGIGSVWGVKGQVGLQEGETTGRFFVNLPEGPGRREVPLGFRLKLDKFKLEFYEPSFRLRIFDITPKEPEFLASADPSKGKEKDKLKNFGVRIVDYWPDYEQVVEAAPLDAKEASPHHGISALAVTGPGGKGSRTWLFTSDDLPAERLEIPGKGYLSFLWSEKKALEYVQSLAGSTEEKHLIKIGDREMIVKVGETYAMPGHDMRFKIEQFFNDFVIDMSTRQPFNRSDRPDNPAIRIAFEDAAGNRVDEGWLFANFATFHSAKEGSPLSSMKYTYSPGRKSGGSEELVVGERKEVWTVGNGQVTDRTPLDLSGKAGIPGLGIAAADLLPSAKVVTKNISRSREARNPVVEIALEGKDRSLLLQEGDPLRLSEELVLVLSEQEENVRDFLSTLSVIEKGRVVLTGTIEVNGPLSYGGYSFYQSNYDPNRPGWTGLQVVRDPGIILVYAGLILLFLGVALVVLVVPYARRYRAAAGARG
jgi:hypothetical protein